MIKYIEWGKHIRWGNFNYLWNTMNYISKKTGHEIRLPDYFAWKYLEKPPIIDNSKDYDELFHFRQTNYTPEELEWTVNWFNERKDKVININLGSNCQSEKWWKEEEEYILERIKIKEEEKQKVKEKYSDVFTKPVIGIGLRLGDFVNHGCFYQIPYKWYVEALKVNFPDYKDYNILVMSDDIETAKIIFRKEDFMYAEPNGTHTHADGFKHYHKDPFEQFILGTLCSHMVIGSSTFSWHQAYNVNKFNGGKIVHSGKNLQGECLKTFYNPDYYPENWIKYE